MPLKVLGKRMCSEGNWPPLPSTDRAGGKFAMFNLVTSDNGNKPKGDSEKVVTWEPQQMWQQSNKACEATQMLPI